MVQIMKKTVNMWEYKVGINAETTDNSDAVSPGSDSSLQ